VRLPEPVARANLKGLGAGGGRAGPGRRGRGPRARPWEGYLWQAHPVEAGAQRVRDQGLIGPGLGEGGAQVGRPVKEGEDGAGRRAQAGRAEAGGRGRGRRARAARGPGVLAQAVGQGRAHRGGRPARGRPDDGQGPAQRHAHRKQALHRRRHDGLGGRPAVRVRGRVQVHKRAAQAQGKKARLQGLEAQAGVAHAGDAGGHGRAGRHEGRRQVVQQARGRGPAPVEVGRRVQARARVGRDSSRRAGRRRHEVDGRRVGDGLSPGGQLQVERHPVPPQVRHPKQRGDDVLGGRVQDEDLFFGWGVGGGERVVKIGGSIHGGALALSLQSRQATEPRLTHPGTVSQGGAGGNTGAVRSSRAVARSFFLFPLSALSHLPCTARLRPHRPAHRRRQQLNRPSRRPGGACGLWHLKKGGVDGGVLERALNASMVAPRLARSLPFSPLTGLAGADVEGWGSGHGF
jgi:hypothetical protein